MVIKKQYNIGQLAEQLQTEVEKSKKYNGVVKLDILTANNILDVLNETNRMEQKHQTLESALTFIEKEDGTQTNLMEEHNKKQECFGKYDEDDLDCLMCACGDKCLKETKEAEGKTNE